MVTTRPHETWHDPAVASYCDDAWRSDAEQEHRKALAQLCRAHIQPQMTVLETGCGTGLVYGQLVPAVIGADRYTGIDIAEPMLALARSRYPDGCFRSGDAYETQFADGSFDAVICFEVLGHLPDIRRVIGELIRVARIMVLFTVWGTASGMEDGEEVAAGRSALFRRYSRDYILSEISAATPEPGLTVTSEDLGAIQAYVIAKRDIGG